VRKEEYEVFNAYKGLQRPLVFRGFKGKYIYIAGGCLIGGLMLSLGLSNVNIILGAITLLVTIGGSLLVILQLQKKGLHGKKQKEGIYIITRIIHRNKE
jgi:hypothetical protein